MLKNFGNPKFKKEAFVGEKPADIYHIPRLEEQNAGLMASISLTTDGPNQFEIIAHETVKAWQDFWDRRNRSSMCKWLGCYSSREDEE